MRHGLRDSVAPREHTATRAEPRRSEHFGNAPAVLLISSLGVAITAFAFHFGRTGNSLGQPLYWLGQAVVFLPVILRITWRKAISTAEAFLLMIGLGLNQYLIKLLYSPDQFRFPDELQHLAATAMIKESDRLFQPNPALPVGSSFPGLAELTAAVSDVSGLSVHTSGAIAIGVCRLIFVGALFSVAWRLMGSARMAALACAIYTTSAHYLFFNAMFLYQAAALAFAMVALWAAYRLRRTASRALTFTAILATAATVVTHHVTAAFLCAALLGLGLTALVDRTGRTARPLLAAVIGIGFAGFWLIVPARQTLDYFAAPARRAMRSFTAIFGSTDSGSVSSFRAPMLETAFQALALITILVIAFGAWRAISRDPNRTIFHWALLAAALSFFATSALRFAGPQGPELAGRASTFTFLPMALLLAWYLHQWLDQSWSDRIRPWAGPATIGLATLLMISGRVGGWPPYWERLPGRQLVSGFESSVTQSNVAAAKWMRAWLGPNHRVGADITGWILVSTYGRQRPVTEVAPIFYTPEWSLSSQQTLNAYAVDFLWVDETLARQAPVNGTLFLVDPQAGRNATALPPANLSKFDSVVHIRRSYDDGTIRIYDVRGMRGSQ